MSLRTRSPHQALHHRRCLTPVPQLAHLLEMARAENVIVAVSRHVDGPMLGGRQRPV